MNNNKDNPEIKSDEFRTLLAEVYELFPKEFANVNVSDAGLASFPELDVIKAKRDGVDSPAPLQDKNADQ